MENFIIAFLIVAVMCYTGYRFSNYMHRPRLVKTIIAGALLFGLSGCLTVKQIERNCDKFAQVCLEETVKETVYRDTTIYLTDTLVLFLPPDTVTITDTVTVDRFGLAWLQTIYREYGLVWVRAGVEASIMNVAAGLTDSTILTPVHDTITLKEVIKEEKITNTPKPVKVKFIPKFYKFTFWVFWVVIVAAALFVISRIYRTKLNSK